MTDYEKKRLRLARVSTAAVVLLALVLIIAVGAAWYTVHQYEVRVDALLTEIELMTDKLSGLDIDVLVSTLNGVSADLGEVDVQNFVQSLEMLSTQLEKVDWEELTDNTNQLILSATESMKVLNTLDMETLNEAIADLQEVVAPLAALAERFK